MIVVGDIDRGGVLAHLFGTVAVLAPADQALVAGFVVNKFRGDPALLEPGLDQLRALTGRPTLGVLPWADGLWLDAEDSLCSRRRGARAAGAAARREWLRVAVVRLPRMSNVTDVDALAAEPGVAVRYVTEPSRVADADLVVLPGSKATVADLAWLRAHRARRRGRRARAGRAAGARDLRRLPDARPADRRPDGVESRAGTTGPRPAGLEVSSRRQAAADPAGTALGRAGARLRDPPRARACGRAIRCCSTGRVRARRGRRPRHALARAAGERRVPPRAARPRRGAGRPHRVPGRTRHVVRRDAPRSSTCSATWSRSTSTPPRCGMSSVTARRRTSRGDLRSAGFLQ